MAIQNGVSLGEATARISIDTSGLRQGAVDVQRLSGDMRQALEGVSHGTAQAEGGFMRVFGAIAQVRGAAGALGISLGVGSVAGVAKLGVEIARTSARASQMEQRFGMLSNIVGESAQEMMQGMREASRAHIADTDLMFAANRAMLLGVADNMEELEMLMRIAGSRAGAMGLTFTQAFDDIVVGIGRMSTPILDNLGIMISANQAYSAFAESVGKTADELTDAEKRQAYYNAVVEQSRELLEQHTSAGVSAAGRFQQMAAASQNMREAFGALIQEDVVSWVRGVTSAFEGLEDVFTGIRESRGFGVRWGDLFAMATGGTTEFLVNDIRRQMESVQREIVELERRQKAALDPANAEYFGNRIRLLEAEVAALNREIERGEQALEGAPIDEQYERERAQLEELEMGYNAMAQARDAALAAGDTHVADAITQAMILLENQINAVTRAWQRFAGDFGILMPQGGGIGITSPMPKMPSTPTPEEWEYDDELNRLQVGYLEERRRIEEQGNRERLSATETFNQQVASTERSYNLSRMREAEDFAVQRARQVASHEQQIARIREDGARREQEMVDQLTERLADIRDQDARRHADAVQDFQERRAQQQADFEERRAKQQADFEERIAKLREDGQKSIARIESDAIRQREQAQRQHRDTLISAAANLDARAVAQEMRRWRTAQADQERTLAERVNQERTSLDERIEQEQKAHEKVLAENQAAHDKRLQQEQEAFDKRRAREQRDLQLRIDQEQAAHAKRVAQAREADEQRIIDQQEAFDAMIAQQDEDRARRLARMQDDHRDQMGEMKRAHTARMTEIGKQEHDRLTALGDSFKAQLTAYGLFSVTWIERQKKLQDDAVELFESMFGEFQRTIEESGLWLANRPQLGPPERPTDFFDPNTPVFNGNRSIVIQDGAIRIELPPNVDAQQLVDTLEQQLAEILQEVASTP